MVDFHTHVLPGMDDGSHDVAMSMKLIDQLKAQGVTTVCLTSHFYPSQNSPLIFRRRRAAAASRLFQAYGGRENLPVKVRLGAEVLFYNGISNDVEMVKTLCYEGSNLLLLEMPFHKWTNGMIQEVLSLHGLSGIQVMLAHVDRYFDYVDDSVFDSFQARGILLSMNCDALFNFKTKKRALRMIRQGKIFALTSDCHNMSNRAPRFDEAFEILEKKKLYDQIKKFRYGLK